MIEEPTMQINLETCENKEVFHPVFVDFDLTNVRILAYEIKILSKYYSF